MYVSRLNLSFSIRSIDVDLCSLPVPAPGGFEADIAGFDGGGAGFVEGAAEA